MLSELSYIYVRVMYLDECPGSVPETPIPFRPLIVVMRECTSLRNMRQKAQADKHARQQRQNVCDHHDHHCRLQVSDHAGMQSKQTSNCSPPRTDWLSRRATSCHAAAIFQPGARQLLLHTRLVHQLHSEWAIVACRLEPERLDPDCTLLSP